MSTEEIVRKFILESHSMEEKELDNAVDMLEEGLVNSLFFIELMTFLEKKFEIKVGMEDLNTDNFKSVNCIKEFVERKKTVSA